MNFTEDSQAMATPLARPSLCADIAPEFQFLVPANIRVERVGFTRNASNTPYLVYWVGDRRCCTFVKRRLFLELVQVLLKLKYGVEDRIRSILSSPEFGLSVKFGDQGLYIPSSYVKTFFERYNLVALKRIDPQIGCECNDLFGGMCVHAVAAALRTGRPSLCTDIASIVQPKLEQKIKPLLRYNPYASGYKACANNLKIWQQAQHFSKNSS